LSAIGHGQVWWADLAGEKVRPVVVLTRSRVAPLLRRVLVAPVTSTVRDIASEVRIGVAEGVKAGSVANLDNAQLLEVDALLGQAGAVSSERWSEFCEAMAHVMACRRGR